MNEKAPIHAWSDLPAGMQVPRLRPLFLIRLRVAPAVSVGNTPTGTRRVAVVEGGTFEGEIDGLSGSVHAGGNDWLTERADGSLHLDARIVLQAGNGDLVMMEYAGIRHGAPEIMRKVAAGEDVPPEEYYFRIAPRFETASKSLDWLNRVVAVGIGQRLRDGVRYSVFELA